MSRHALGTVAAIAVVAPALAAPSIETIEVRRADDDLTISWTAAPAPVDGYRVYRSIRPDCTGMGLVHEGLFPEYTAADALAPTARPAIWRVATVTGMDEGPLSGPIYAWPLPLDTAVDGAWLPFPFATGLADSVALCGDLTRLPPEILAVGWFDPLRGQPLTQVCLQLPPAMFPTTPGHAYHARADVGGVAFAWGHAHPQWLVSLDVVAEPPQTGVGTYFLSLPPDHDYVDLQDIADDIAPALGVRTWDASSSSFVGRTRDSTMGPWTGTNLTLTPGAPVVVLVEVESPTTWSPRRLCADDCAVPPPAVEALTVLEQGPDLVGLWWQPLPQATGGYGVFQVDSKSALASIPMLMPELEVLEQSPPFPVIVQSPGSGAMTYYEVLARCDGGSWGAR